MRAASVLQRVFVKAIGNDEFESAGSGTKSIANLLQFRFATARKRPAQVVANSILSKQVLGDQRAGEASGSLNDDVEVTSIF